jgi:hypothetical protein
MQMYRSQVIGVPKIANVLWQWKEPAHDCSDKTGWRLFNAATFALTGRVSETRVPRLICTGSSTAFVSTFS